jgi:hypothetical protein
MYGKVHPYLQMLQGTFDADLFSQSEDTVCFWATNGLDVLELPERTEGRWQGRPGGSSCVDGNGGKDNNFDDDFLAFTFRVDIPLDLPHSVHATTCRYFYSADVLVKTKTQQQILKRGFQLTTNPHQDTQFFAHKQKKEMVISSRVKFGNCLGMAHSNGLPCHLSATEIHRPKGQMTVIQNDQHRRMQHDVQTIRVSNALGQPVCVMTFIGTQSLIPGSRIHIQWDFPEQYPATEDWIPCHQVSACLQGEENAIYEDGTTKRTQSFLFDTCHEWVDPGVTDRVSKTMLLSSDNNLEGTPCDLSTDVMEVSVWCQVDITVQEEGEYNNLSLRIPCRIHHGLVDEDEETEAEENRIIPLGELLGDNLMNQDASTCTTTSTGTKNDAFPTHDIHFDLKTLALLIEDKLQSWKQR